MGKPPVLRMIARVKFRVEHAESDLNAMLEIIRQAAGEPDYCGPDIALLERIAADIAAVRAAVQRWPARLCRL